MAATAVEGEALFAELALRELDEAEEIENARNHPAYLLDRVQCLDAKTGERFEFELVDETKGWYWQRALLDSWIACEKNLVLKARQLGITWLAAGLGLWTVLTKPGARVLVISINEEEASKVVNRLWDMLESLPKHLRMGTEVVKPARGARPHTVIELRHPDGRISSVLGLPSTKKAGHGETAALVILDEYARHEYARESWKAVLPTMAGGGKVIAISTANGVSNELTGEGNFFHHLYSTADDKGINVYFLPWHLHPDRGDDWYRAYALALPVHDRAEQFPSTEDEAFVFTGDLYFDIEALGWYAQHGKREPLYRFDFQLADPRTARKRISDLGAIRVFAEPHGDHSYAIGADVATGRGADFSAAFVVDLTSMELVAELHAKIDPDLFATQLHFLGKWYGTARIAVEMGGGYGEAVVIPLRDGKDGRPAYPKLYRHIQGDRPDLPIQKPFGYPINTKTRPLIISQLEKAIRERALPYMSHGLLRECQTFVHQNTNPSPRALDGCNDDRVFAAAIALEMFRLYGHHPERAKRKTKRKSATPYPWLAA